MMITLPSKIHPTLTLDKSGQPRTLGFALGKLNIDIPMRLAINLESWGSIRFAFVRIIESDFISFEKSFESRTNRPYLKPLSL